MHERYEGQTRHHPETTADPAPSRSRAATRPPKKKPALLVVVIALVALGKLVVLMAAQDEGPPPLRSMNWEEFALERGSLAIMGGDAETAQSALSAVVEGAPEGSTAPEHLQALIGLAVSKSLQGDFTAAVRLGERVLATKPAGLLLRQAERLSVGRDLGCWVVFVGNNIKI